MAGEYLVRTGAVKEKKQPKLASEVKKKKK